MTDAEADWKNLPTLPLLLILDKLDVPSNPVRFGAVCKHWYFVFSNFLDLKRRSSPNMVPMLLIPTRMSNRVRQLCSLQIKTKFYNIELPESHSKRFCGSSHGWLAAVDKNMVITLLNPFKNGITIDLPEIAVNPKSASHQYDVHKVILSADPLSHSDSYVVVVIYGLRCRLAFYKSERKSWIYLDKGLTAFTDVIFYKNLAYAIGTRSLIVSFDVNDGFDDNLESPKVKILMPACRKVEDNIDSAYLVESSTGDLFSIKKEIDVEDYHPCAHFTKNFKVFKLVLDDQSGRLLEKEVKNMNGDVVFVGDNHTLAVSALDFPEGQPNSIYFTDDYYIATEYWPLGPRDIGFFNMKDGKVGKYYRFKPWHKYLPPYIWVQPPTEFVLR
ncbi:Cyclin F-box [Theobroma cacao]|uniref:Cyclin F-box n=1 Tax=Theobroma cacao TaxID=3641 RepID=A0A061G6Y1_THECC|nr:Cyclin F-box [Theobroma cacao]